MTQAAATTPAVINIRQLAFRWHTQSASVLVLDELRIDQGERVFIEGPSGSGKSTLLSLLAGVTVPQQGSLHVLGQQLEQLNGIQRDLFRAHHVGYIFQLFNLLPYLSVVENVVLPCQFSNIRHARALQRSRSLEAEAQRLLGQLDIADTLWDLSVTTLSVGQQQRVAAARALMGAPELLIADEPTSSLDENRREAFLRLLFDECEQVGSTVIFVSHDVSLEKQFDRTIHLAAINKASVQAVRERT